ncbi:MAG: homocysteine S-methyltransferase family protein [Leptolyngbyaceae cyanobacterium MO_188.B28]|nr:homocysteine S-methyltransferase family protein [Leptolyngbyaceae cyanobacterium MO_188.B28]
MYTQEKTTAQYRHNLPQLSKDLFVTDGGIETTLIFHEGLNLPYFASFDLLKDAFGYEILHKYFRTYAKMSQAYNVGLILESATWRASHDWGMKLDYSTEALAEINRKSISLLEAIRSEYETETNRIVISGCLGPRGDGYDPSELMTVDEAAEYHAAQIKTFQASNADLATAITMTYAEEAIGVALVAQSVEMPVVISFTVETDGCLPTGQSLQQAIAQVDAATHNAPLYYMINCAHPTHFAEVLLTSEPWVSRIRGIRANASRKSHAELDEADSLDEGNPAELGDQCSQLQAALPNLNILGGCCGTDHRHIRALCKALAA